MNILHISSASTWRGGERQVQFLIDGLQDHGFYNFLMTPKNSDLSSRINLTPDRILIKKKGLLSTFQNIRALRNCCRQNEIDIIHGHDSHAHSLLWMAYKFGGLTTKSVVTRRLINPIKKRSFNKYNHPKVEKIICISEAVKKVLSSTIQDQSRLSVINSSIDITPPKNKKKTDTQNNDFVIGYVAAFTQEKDHKTFIATAKYLKAEYPDRPYKFILVGDGPLLKNIKKESEDISEHITFTGFVNDVEAAYSNIDLLLHTSKSEALGTSLLDAMKYGIPIVTTDIGGIPEIIDHNKNGFLCKQGDYKVMAEKIHMLSSDEEVRQKFVENALQKLNTFDKSIMIEKTLELYQQVLMS